MTLKSFAYKILFTLSSKKEKEKLRVQKLASELITHPDFYLIKTGFMKSLLNKKLLDNNNENIPWMNYPVISFLKERLNNNMNVFEYGSGSSTIFFARIVKKIISVEYDKIWFDEVSDLIKNEKNAQVIFTVLNETYPLKINEFDEQFDVVIIDGRKRVKCANAALGRLSDDGVLILDDSARAYYQEIFTTYKNAGYKYLKFEGLKPTGFSIDETTIFYKSGNNCFNL